MSGSNILLDTVGDAGGEIILEDVRVARLKNPEKNVGLFKLPKSTIKTLLTTANAGASDTQFTVRRNFCRNNKLIWSGNIFCWNK